MNSNVIEFISNKQIIRSIVLFTTLLLGFLLFIIITPQENKPHTIYFIILALSLLAFSGIIIWLIKQLAEKIKTSEISLQTTLQVLDQSYLEFKKIENSLVDYKQVLNEHSLVVITDTSGTVKRVNHNFCQLSGYSHEELIGSNLRILNSGAKPKSYWKAMFKKVSQGGIWRDHVLNKAKDGRLYWVDATIMSLLDDQGEIKSYISVKTDITEQVESRSELTKYTNELEQTVLERTQALQKKQDEAVKAKEEAIKANHAKSDFLASMSHEIRTPMNAIIGLTRMMLKSQLNQKQTKQMKKVERSSQSLLHIINDILDFSKIEAGKLEIEQIPFSLSDILKHLGELFREPCVQKNNELNLWIHPDCASDLIGDPTRLEQILLNLIGNANKFTSNGEIEVQVQGAEDTYLLFSVRDTGIGIGQEKLNKLFDPFTQADDSITRKYGGTGLGLSISSNLVKKMGGELSVKSQLQMGSNFYFTIALAVQSKAEPRAYDLPEKLKNMSVLVIDDNQTALKITKKMLNSLNFEVETALSGINGIEIIQDRVKQEVPLYELILLDWIMPEMDGIETAEQIFSVYASSSQQKPYILIQTASPEDEEINTFVNQYDNCLLIPKPIKYFSLYQRIAKLYQYKIESDVLNEQDQYLNLYKRYLYNQHVLIVEDNEINQEVVSDVLQSMGMQVSIVEDGQQALNFLYRNQQENKAIDEVSQEEAGKVDVVLMDIQMPVMDGLTATKRLREDQVFDTLPIIALTAHAQQEHQNECYEAGMNGFVSKPFDERLLFKELTRSLFISQKQRLLLVEDDKINQEVISEQLDSLGFACDIAATGTQAIDLYQNNRYAAIFMDIHLPDSDGYSVSQTIRSMEEKREQQNIVIASKKVDFLIPIIALSASTLDEDKKKALASGMNAYCTKPINLDLLEQRLLQWLKPEITTVTEAEINKETSANETSKESIEHQHSRMNKTSAIQQQKGKVLDESIINKGVTMMDLIDEKILEQIKSKPKLFQRLLKLYVNTYPKTLLELIQAVEDKNYPQIRSVAHSFKSSSKQMGATSLGEKLFLFEVQGRDGNLEANIDEQIKHLKDEFAQVLNALEKFIEKE